MAQEREGCCIGPAGGLYVGAHADGCTVFVGKSAVCLLPKDRKHCFYGGRYRKQMAEAVTVIFQGPEDSSARQNPHRTQQNKS